MFWIKLGDQKKNSFSYRFFTSIQFFPNSLGSLHNQLMPLVDTWPLQVMAVVGLEVPILLFRKAHVPGGPQSSPSMQILHAARMEPRHVNQIHSNTVHVYYKYMYCQPTFFHDLLEINWFSWPSLFLHRPVFFIDWIAVRNICDNEALANLVKISHMWMKVGLQYCQEEKYLTVCYYEENHRYSMYNYNYNRIV